MKAKMKLYEILVPTHWPLSQMKISIGVHKEWDEQVTEITGGLTLHPKVSGKCNGTKETTIPIRIACTPQQMAEIAELTRDWYNQDTVMYYVVSEEVYFV